MYFCVLYRFNRTTVFDLRFQPEDHLQYPVGVFVIAIVYICIYTVNY